ncbi:MAG: Glu/Leu/Phe/Val dehydrogenase [Pirellulaceae bacterium]|jgi:glutamate dehydrogenase/leucine dehydrogenase|nr:Glu/Leu/Phe/Val dehydrogenase [Pirellulaceae bacterium]MDP6722415.1 Glu/Leu/Phe/Val dehydrogenase [Pirellulaceae bacterium]
MRTTTFDYDRFCDELGPAKVMHVYEPASGLKGIVVVDNVACGPAIGGVRMAADVSSEEVFRLARAMTMKNAAAGLAHGGGKAGIIADPKTADKPRLVRAFARAIQPLVDYIPGPDMGTDEQCMAWIQDEIGRSVGLPRVLGGIPLDEIGATGYGLAQCAEIAALFCDLDLDGARVAIEGFGNVGQHAARYLTVKGCKLIAASDSQGAVHNPNGIDVNELVRVKQEAGNVTVYGGGQQISQSELFAVPCDILIPAARPDCIHIENVAGIQAKLILQGANIPATAEAEAALHKRGVLVVPDFIANAGGVICGAVEYHGGNENYAFDQISMKVRRNTKEVLTRSRDKKLQPREAAVQLARERVLAAMALQA